jgi:hypothetical protein
LLLVVFQRLRAVSEPDSFAYEIELLRFFGWVQFLSNKELDFVDRHARVEHDILFLWRKSAFDFVIDGHDDPITCIFTINFKAFKVIEHLDAEFQAPAYDSFILLLEFPEDSFDVVFFELVLDCDVACSELDDLHE